MQTSEKIFLPFPSDRVCDFKNPNIFHFDHPSCCRSDDFTAWRTNYLKPMLDWESANPVPNFKKIRPCNTDYSDHVDSPYCCNIDVLKQFNSFLNKSFKLIPLTYSDELTWGKLCQVSRHLKDN